MLESTDETEYWWKYWEKKKIKSKLIFLISLDLKKKKKKVSEASAQHYDTKMQKNCWYNHIKWDHTYIQKKLSNYDPEILPLDL